MLVITFMGTLTWVTGIFFNLFERKPQRIFSNCENSIEKYFANEVFDYLKKSFKDAIFGFLTNFKKAFTKKTKFLFLKFWTIILKFCFLSIIGAIITSSFRASHTNLPCLLTYLLTGLSKSAVKIHFAASSAWDPVRKTLQK